MAAQSAEAHRRRANVSLTATVWKYARAIIRLKCLARARLGISSAGSKNAGEKVLHNVVAAR